MKRLTDLIDYIQSVRVGMSFDEKVEDEYQVQMWIDHTEAEQQYRSDLPLDLSIKRQLRLAREYAEYCDNKGGVK